MEEQKDTLGTDYKAASVPKIPKFHVTDSYVSLILGVLVVVAGLILVASFLRNRPSSTKEISSTSTQLSEVIDQVQNEKKEKKIEQKKYPVLAGDTLWSISQSFYQSGFEWKTIADANKIINPESLEVGMVLIIPEKSIPPTESTLQAQIPKVSQTITGDSYAVDRGDNLWNIALRAYGDGFRWVDIARENNLMNPSLIHKGNIFKIPR